MIKNKLLTDIMSNTHNIKSDIEISHITSDSRDIKDNTLFIAIKGFKNDGHNYIEKSIENGSVAILYEKYFDITGIENKYKDIIFIESSDTRKEMASIASLFYDEPTKKSHIIAVCGTNGKTTTTYLIKAILENAKKTTTLIGTIKNMIGEKAIETNHTTPESIELQKLFSQMLECNSYHAVMETSSHALFLGRCNNIDYDTAIFSNFTEDHLDFHNNMDEYFKAKCLIFDILKNSDKKNKKTIINIHTERFDEMKKYIENLGLDIITYGLTEKAHYYAKIKSLSINNIEYEFYIKGKYIKDVSLSLLGEFNVLNSLSALAYASEYGYDIEEAINAIKDVQVDGRFEIVTKKNMPFSVIVDYAHTPDGLINVLSAAKKLNPSRVITVFGCGGDRDRKKRPLMANAVERYSDVAFLTLDNPRTECFDQIIEDIEKGFSHSFKYTKIMARKKAIESAINEAKDNDIVVIAGKGHETYQIFKNKTIYFDDRVAARETLSVIFH